MDKKDVEKVIQNLQTKPFICSEDYILLDDSYVILRKGYFEELKNLVEKVSGKESAAKAKWQQVITE